MTAEELAAMIDEAAWVARRLPARGVRPGGYKTAWPDVVHDKWAAYGWEAARGSPERPTARQIDLLDLTTRIVSDAPRGVRTLLWDVGMIKHRSGGTNWARVARKHGVHPATAKRRWTEALLVVARRA